MCWDVPSTLCQTVYNSQSSLLLAQTVKVSQRWEVRVFSGLSWAHAKPCKFPEICWSFSKSLMDISFQGFFFSIFWSVTCWPWPPRSCQGAVIKQLHLILSNKCSVSRAPYAKWAQSQVKWRQALRMKLSSKLQASPRVTSLGVGLLGSSKVLFGPIQWLLDYRFSQLPNL